MHRNQRKQIAKAKRRRMKEQRMLKARGVNWVKLSQMPYPEFLRTRYWRALRERVLRRDNFACTECGWPGIDDLHVHHKTYERRGREHLSDLATLCATCHSAEHGTGSFWDNVDILFLRRKTAV